MQQYQRGLHMASPCFMLIMLAQRLEEYHTILAMVPQQRPSYQVTTPGQVQLTHQQQHTLKQPGRLKEEQWEVP